MIIIEGPDNAGKTTLGKRLAETMEIPLVHSTRPAKDSSEGCLIEHAVLQLEPRRIVMDRNYLISELVYGNVLRGGPALGLDRHTKLLEDLLEMNYLLIIYCRPSADTILNNSDREQMDGVVKYHPQLIAQYDHTMSKIKKMKKGLLITYNYETDDYLNLVTQCDHHMILQYGDDL